ncbi:MAG: molybdopterin molybdotransferase MoeA [Sulfurimonadaceae bacterium]|jgi:molybdopterin molybdotransferase|nr:molybdopterin molybdotransferase MoeA [Sulfurimonadaceae bacterium]
MAISVEEALELIYKNTKQTSLQILPIEQALGFVLAVDIIATHNLPPYDNSAMDGYAVKIADSGKSLKVCETIFAGDNSNTVLENEQAIKIMTGARIPKGCDTIVPIEEVTVTGEEVTLPDSLVLAKHIRFYGEDIRSGEKILEKNQKLHAHHITLLASQGISHIQVYKKVRIALFSSGNELRMHYETVEPHQLYNTNTPTFYARALELGCEVTFIGTASDTLEDIQNHIKSALDSDIIITSGGISVGDADFTKEAFGAFDYTNIFDGIDIKPGKPTSFGRIGDTFILNLPGNPLAATLNFELFAHAMILTLQGTNEKYLNTIEAKMAHDFSFKKGKRTLIPGYFDGCHFTPSKKFAPGMVSPLATANGFIMVDANCSGLACGARVKFFSTRFSFVSTIKRDYLTQGA